jgi:integrase/recombinase XerD
MIRTYARKANIEKKVTAHTFRHTCATGMLKNKGDLNTIRKILGHSSLNTTQIYTHLDISDLKAVHKKCHPREKDRE